MSEKGPRFLRYPDLKAQKGIPFSRQYLYAMVQQGRFPRPIYLSEMTKGWLEHEVEFVARRSCRRARCRGLMQGPKTEKPASEISGGGLPKNEQLGGQLSFPNNEVATPTQVPPMSRGEREDLQRLVRQREKVLKSAARQRSAELLADFENQMGQQYSFDQDTVWEQAVKSVEPLVAKAKAQIADRCRELGIPRQFAPDVDLGWHHRGYGNVLAERRVELRRMATTQIAAIESKAIVEIEMSCLQAQTQIAAAGLTSVAAMSFIEKLPSIETLMPLLAFAEVSGEAEPPIAEQLISPNAMRQRRYRERHRNALRDGSDDGGEHGL